MARGDTIEVINGLTIRLNPDPAVAELPDDEVYQIVKGEKVIASGGKTSIYKLVKNDAWLKRYA